MKQRLIIKLVVGAIFGIVLVICFNIPIWATAIAVCAGVGLTELGMEID